MKCLIVIIMVLCVYKLHKVLYNRSIDKAMKPYVEAENSKNE